ncbi:hypothetical protein [Desulfobacula sp.]
MKLINSKNLQESEKEFIDTINAELDWDAIKKMLMEKPGFILPEKIECNKGDLVVYKDEIAYKFDFEIKIPVSVTVNRQGDCLDISNLGKEDEESNDPAFSQKGDTNPPIGPDQENKVAQMASNIADMISEINQGDE